MRKRFALVLLAWLTVAAAGAQTGKIRISATSDVFVSPDVAQIVFSITSADPDRAAAEAKQAAQVKEILEAIEALQLPKLQTRTPPSQTTKQEAWPPPGYGTGGGGLSYGAGTFSGGPPRKAGYVVATVIEVWFEGDAVTLEAGVNKIMTIARAHGAANMTPDIACRDLETVRQKALAAATKLAIQRAQAMAKAAGVRITGYSYLGPCPENARTWTENPQVHKGPVGYGGWYGGGGYGGGGPSPAPVIEVHNTQVSATVWVTATY